MLNHEDILKLSASELVLLAFDLGLAPEGADKFPDYGPRYVCTRSGQMWRPDVYIVAAMEAFAWAYQDEWVTNMVTANSGTGHVTIYAPLWVRNMVTANSGTGHVTTYAPFRQHWSRSWGPGQEEPTQAMALLRCVVLARAAQEETTL